MFATDEHARLHRLLVSEVGGFAEAFDADELAYQALTSKPEFVVRNEIAWALHRQLWPTYQVTREWSPPGGGVAKTDLAVLRAAHAEPMVLLEAKAMYTFDAVKTNREQFPRYVEEDIRKTLRYGTQGTLAYGLLLVVHPRSPVPAELKQAVKFSAPINSSLKKYPEDELRRQSIEYLDQRLRQIGELTSKGVADTGIAFGIKTQILYWLIGPVTMEDLPVSI